MFQTLIGYVEVDGKIDDMDELAMEYTLNLTFAVRTIQNINRSAERYTNRASNIWVFDGDGDWDNTINKITFHESSNNRGQARFNEVLYSDN